MKLEHKVSKEKFVAAYNKFAPKKWIKFAFKYFSKSTEAKDMKLSQSFTWILLILFVVGFVSTVANLPRTVIAVSTIGFSVILSVLVLFLLAAVLSNNKRIKKIAKELNVTLQEYNDLADYYEEYVK